MRRMGVVAAILVALSSGACTVTESTNVKTSGIWASFTVMPAADAGQVVCLAALRVGGPGGTVVDLVGDDYLTCNGVEMTEYVEPVTGYHWSRAVVPEDPSGAYIVTFNRPDEEVETEIVMPKPPEILQVGESGTLYFSVANTIEWDATEAGDEVQLTVDGDCIEPYMAVVDDTGSYTIPNDGLALNGTDESCTVTVTLERRLYFEVNAAYQDGVATGKNIFSVTANIVAPLPTND